jgi:hypothetical protein
MTRGKPWREVLRIAAEKQSDLIVMGVQGRGAADLLFFGSTTQHLVREASCPVLTLRHASAASPATEIPRGEDLEKVPKVRRFPHGDLFAATRCGRNRP